MAISRVILTILHFQIKAAEQTISGFYAFCQPEKLTFEKASKMEKRTKENLTSDAVMEQMLVYC